MQPLEKARLTAISSDPSSARALSPPIEVQFNPTTLRLQLANQASGGRARTHPARQYLGTGSRTLTVELVFDTADEGDTETPRSVREKTDFVERLALPQAEGGNKQAPPKVRFEWGPLVLEGIVESVNVDLEHFAADGTPLRAKVGLAIKEQDARDQLLERGAGANRPGSAPASPQAPPGGAPGTSGRGSERSAAALGGESLADFAARQGLDPAGWRGLAQGLAATDSLPAGVEIGFDLNVGAAAGVGVAPGISAGATASLEASFGLDPAGAAPASAAGFHLAAAGGVASAIESVKIARAAAAQREAKAAFASSAPATAGVPASVSRPAMPEQPRMPLARAGLPSPGAAAPGAPLPPRADPRAVSFGSGVPLRPTFGDAARRRASGGLDELPTTGDPTVPRWKKLPERRTTGTHQRGHQHGARCDCHCRRGPR